MLNLNFNMFFLGALIYKTSFAKHCVTIRTYIDLMFLMVSPAGLQWSLVCANGWAQLELISYCGQCTSVFVFVSVLESNVMCARRAFVCVCTRLCCRHPVTFLTGNSLFPTSFCLFLFVRIIFTPLFLSQAPHTILLIHQYSNNTAVFSKVNHTYTSSFTVSHVKSQIWITLTLRTDILMDL